jgi:hypothetical protein
MQQVYGGLCGCGLRFSAGKEFRLPCRIFRPAVTQKNTREKRDFDLPRECEIKRLYYEQIAF